MKIQSKTPPNPIEITPTLQSNAMKIFHKKEMKKKKKNLPVELQRTQKCNFRSEVWRRRDGYKIYYMESKGILTTESLQMLTSLCLLSFPENDLYF